MTNDEKEKYERLVKGAEQLSFDMDGIIGYHINNPRIKIAADMHTHTLASGHAYGTIREMAQTAAEKELEILGISEHAPGIPGTVDPIYFCNLKVVPRDLYGVRILFGSEINVLNDGSLSLEQKYIDRLDYAIVGIHDLCYENAGVKKNTENLIKCMENDKVFFVSHPDDDHNPLDYEMLVKAAKELHVALEVNNSSLLKPDKRINCVENYKTMLSYCMEYGVPVIVNSDAHDPSAVGKVNLAIDLLMEQGFDEELVLNADTERVLEFIGFSEQP